jgi:hypothetical protein
LALLPAGDGARGDAEAFRELPLGELEPVPVSP